MFEADLTAALEQAGIGTSPIERTWYGRCINLAVRDDEDTYTFEIWFKGLNAAEVVKDIVGAIADSGFKHFQIGKCPLPQTIDRV